MRGFDKRFYVLPGLDVLPIPAPVRAFAQAQVSFRLHARFEVATLVDFDPDGAAASHRERRQAQ
jgi:hypothetical protein